MALGGEYDMSRMDDLRPCLLAVPPGSHVVADLSDVTFIDSSALGVFVEARVKLAASGGSIAVRNPGRLQLRLFQITGLTEMFGLG